MDNKSPIPSIVGPVFGMPKPGPHDDALDAAKFMVLTDKEGKITDFINYPPHYTQGGGVEPIDFITSNSMGFCAGNVVKYVTRYKYKNGLEDLKKAKWYLERLIADEYPDDDEAA